MDYIIQLLLSVPVLILCFTLHEIAHGLAAYAMGDRTAKNTGRLSLNPLNHIDWLGFLLLLVARIGWAKPVPVNMYNLKNPKTDMIFVSLAGITANFLFAICAGILMFIIRTFFANVDIMVSMYLILQYVVVINIVLFIFNLIPIPPLDGSRVVLFLLPRELAQKYAQRNYLPQADL